MFARLLRISRPRFWLYVIGSFFIGIGGVMTVGEAININFDVALWVLYFTLPANLFIYGINDCADFDTDQFNQKKGTYEARVSRNEIRLIVLWIVLLHVLFLPVFLRAEPMVLLMFGIFIAGNLLYSLPPFRFKRIPFVDSISNGVICAAIGLLGYYIAGGTSFSWWAVASGFLWSAVMHAYSAIPDIGADKKAGIRTVATVMGVHGTLVLSFLSYILIGILLYLGGHYVHAFLVLPYLVLVFLSIRAIRNERNMFGIYKIYPYVTYVVGMCVYGLSVYW